jgi:hypothetical protein
VATVPSESNTTSPASAMSLGQFSQLSNQKKLGLILSAAAVVALLAGALMWSQTPEYRVLYNNVPDQDGAAIIGALQQMNVPYKFSESGGAILVPEKQVHEVRLRLAGQGLPKGGLAGFELMENQNSAPVNSLSRLTTSAPWRVNWRVRFSPSPQCKARVCIWQSPSLRYFQGKAATECFGTAQLTCGQGAEC